MIDFDKGLGAIPKVLEALQLRAKVAMHNIANQNTPGYQRYTVRFEEELRRAHERGEDGSTVSPKVERVTDGPPGQNNVSVIDETATLEKVRLMHELFTRRAGSYYQRLNKAIFGRG